MRFDRISMAVAVAGVANFVNLYAPQAILPSLAEEFSVSPARTGLTITAPLLAVAMVAPFAGTISDRLGRKRLIVAACTLMIIPTLLVASAGSLDMLLVWRFLQGLVMPFIFAVTVAYIGDECEGATALRVTGSYALGSIVGGFSGRFIAGIAADLGGWRFAFVMIAALTALGAATIAVVLPREQHFRPLQGGLRGALLTYGEHLTNPRLLGTCAVGFGMLFCNVATYTFVNFYLADPPFSLNQTQLGFVFGVYLVGLMTTAPFMRLAARIGRRATLAIVLGLSASGLVMTLVASVSVAIAGLALLSAGLFAVQSLSLSFIGVSVRRAKSTAVGLYVTLFYIGGALGGIVPGVLWHAAGWPGVVGLIVAVMAVMMVAGGLSWREVTARS